MFWKKEKQYRYILKPQPDITAYELAQVIPLLVNSPEDCRSNIERVEALPDNVRRHFILKERGQWK